MAPMNRRRFLINTAGTVPGLSATAATLAAGKPSLRVLRQRALGSDEGVAASGRTAAAGGALALYPLGETCGRGLLPGVVHRGARGLMHGPVGH